MTDTFKVAAIQAASVFLDSDACVEKACSLIREAAAAGARLAVFPEAFIPGYPLWVWFIPSGKTHPLRKLYSELHRNSISIPGPETERLGQVAAECRITVAIGVNERNSEASDSTIYNTLLYIGDDGSILGKHRKLIPTAGERLVWGQGAEASLDVIQLPYARVGGLICWENYMPLARYALFAQGEQIHVAPTWDRGEPWLSSMRHIAKEGRCFVIGVCQAFHRDHIPDTLEFKKEYLGNIEGWINPGQSLIVDPDGKILAGPLDSEEGILYADIEADQLIGPRWQLDVAGHYARPDLFSLHVNQQARPFIQSHPEESSSQAADPYNLTRFVEAQEGAYDRALSEIRAGRKQSHWMWYIFPQLAGLGSSPTAVQFSIKNGDEARAYLAHPILGPRLIECAETILHIDGKSAHDIFGSPDDLKLRSCATLFAHVSPPEAVFQKVLDKYFDGVPDPKSISLLDIDRSRTARSNS